MLHIYFSILKLNGNIPVCCYFQAETLALALLSHCLQELDLLNSAEQITPVIELQYFCQVSCTAPFQLLYFHVQFRMYSTSCNIAVYLVYQISCLKFTSI